MIRFIFILLLTVHQVEAQQVDTTFGSTDMGAQDEALGLRVLDTIPMDTLRPILDAGVVRVAISRDSLTSRVDYGARDSMRFDNVERMIYLYGEAYVNYEGLSLTADFIQVNLDSSIALAKVGRDSADHLVGIPEFQDGGQKFNAMKMRYNFKTKKGMVYDAVTQESDIYVRGTTTKYIAGQDEDVIYNENAVFTTCNHPEPHYGVRSWRQKVIPNKLVVVGPSIVEIAGLPTPLVLPFGFFPLTKGKRSGLILPRDYEYSEQWGFGIKEVGYYLPINDYMDTKILGDIYFNGSWAMSNVTAYKKRYRYNGRFEFSYSLRKQEIFNDYREQKTRSIRLYWRHDQDAKANPFHQFDGDVNFQINRFDQLNENDASSALRNTIRSSVTYRRIFPDRPFTLSVGMNHDQNNNTRDINITLPDIKFNLRRIQPFRKKQKIGERRWYEDIGMTYALTIKNKYSTKDSLLLEEGFEPEKMKYGVKHSISTSANYSVLKYLQFNTSVNYDEFWHFQSLDKKLSPESIIRADTVDQDGNGNYVIEYDTTFGVLRTDTLPGFKPFRDVRVSTGFSTKLFGTARFKGKIRGLRHVMTPNISLNYSPNTRQERYYAYYDTDTRPQYNDEVGYSRFLSNPIGTPSPAEQDLSLSFNLDHNFEAKYFSRKDSTEKKVKLLDKVSMRSSYNIALDSFRWSRVTMSTFANFFKGLTKVNFTASFDPYGMRYDQEGVGRRVEVSSLKENGQLLRFENIDIRMTTIFTVRQLADLLSFKNVDKSDPNAAPPETQREDLRSAQISDRPKSEVKSLLDLVANFRFNHTFNFRVVGRPGLDTLLVSNHYLNLNGNLDISPKWSIYLGRIGYDFKQNRITYPDLGLTRDLHCWSLTFNWQPERGTYSMYIGVKPGSMDFLKVPYRKNNVDAFY